MKMIPLTLLSLLGLINAAYLHWQYLREKNSGQKMFCLIGGECFSVIDSKYGKTLGIKNEYLGFLFYIAVLIFSILAVKSQLFFIVIILATGSSLYLFIIQSLILKKYCSWCLIAIAINLLIFLYFILT